jgi:O-antigen ligase
MTRERLDNWCNKGVLFLVLAILVFGPLATGAVRPLEFLIIQGLTAGAVLLWMIRLWLNPGHRLLWPPICWAVWAFVLYAIIRYKTADLEYPARQELIRVWVYALLFFVVLNNLVRSDAAQIISSVMIFLGVGISMYAIYQFATGSNRVWHFIRPVAYNGRGSGTYICPNHLAGLLEMLLPVGLAYVLTGRLGHLLRVFLGYSSVVILAGIAVTLSRGGWVATAVACFIFFVCLLRKREYRIPAVALIVLIVAGATLFYFKASLSQRRVQRMLAVDSPHSIIGRLWLWEPAIQIWRDHFWIGVGPAHFDYRFPNYRPEEIQARPGYAHNDYLNTLADWGVVGAALIAASVALLFWGVFKTWKFVGREQGALGTKPSNRAAFILGASNGLLAILVHSFTDFNMHVPANAIVAVTLMALLSGHLRFVSERYWVSPRLWTKVLATTIGLGSLVYLAEQGWRRGWEYVWLDRAEHERLYLQTKTAESNKSPENWAATLDLAESTTAATKRYVLALRQAADVEPMNFETTYELAETLRRLSYQGLEGYQQLAAEAIKWFQRGTRLNPYDPYNHLGIGMCLDWLGQHAEGGACFERAVKLDPNNYYVLALRGWHHVQTAEYAAAKESLERSLQLQHAWHNPVAAAYLPIVKQKLDETANKSAPSR